MSQTITWNGQSYPIPVQGDAAPWGTFITTFLVAIPAGALQKTGGSFTLTADTDFGATFGLKSAYYKSRAATPAAAGVVRLGNLETISWKNAGGSGDKALTVNASDDLTYAGTKITISGAIVNADIAAGAAIVFSKMAALSNSKAVVTNSSGVIVSAAATTDTEIGYVNGVTSAIQTQINTKAPTASPTFTGTVTAPNIALTDTTNQLVIGTTRTVTLSLPTPATASRIYTFPDIGAAATVAYLEGTQTFSGSKIFSAAVAMNNHKILGLTNGTAVDDAAAFGQIKVLQTITATSATPFSTTSNTFQTTNLSATITPTSASNRILIIASGAMQGVTGNHDGSYSLFRDSTNLGGTTGFGDVFTTSGGATDWPVAVVYIDSPASTSAIVYSVKILSANNTNTMTFGPYSTQKQSIVLIEVV